MVQTGDKSSRPSDKQNERCEFTKLEPVQQKNRERHKLALSEYFKPKSKKFIRY